MDVSPSSRGGGTDQQDNNSANCPYEGLFKGFGLSGKSDATQSHPMIRINSQHNKSTLWLGEEKSPRERFEYVEQQRNPPPLDRSFYIEHAAAANRHVDNNKSSIVMGDDGPPFHYPANHEILHHTGLQPASQEHHRVVNPQHNKSTVFFGDATQSERFEYAEERRGHATSGRKGQEELLFEAVAQQAYDKRLLNRNRRNESSLVFGTDAADMSRRAHRDYPNHCKTTSEEH